MPADLNDYFNKGKGNSGGGSGGGGGDRPNRPQRPKRDKPEFLNEFSKKTGWLYALIGLIALLVIAKPFVVINSGEVGIKATAGKYEKDPLRPGLHFFIPFIQEVMVVDTKVRSINYTRSAGHDMSSPTYRMGGSSGVINVPSISALDARGLLISMDITVQYRLKPDTAPQTIATYGTSWEEKIINPIVRDVVRNVIGSYKAEELPIKRNDIAEAIKISIEKQINAKSGSPVELSTVNLREIVLPAKIVEQIERVQIAKQEGDRVQLEVLRAKQEAEKKAALAQGDADARKIRAQGAADAIIIEAEAKAFENTKIGESLTSNMLQLKQIEVQGQFNQALSVNKNAQIFLTPGGSTPNIWVDSKSKSKATAVKQ
jgi:regulator of protease activity HflC (stomatin/prohibitin superfamily)